MKHTGTVYGKDIINEIHNRKVVCIEKPQHTQAVLDHHQDMVTPKEKIFMRLQAATASKEKVIIGTSETDAYAAIALAGIKNAMETEQAVFNKLS